MQHGFEPCKKVCHAKGRHSRPTRTPRSRRKQERSVSEMAVEMEAKRSEYTKTTAVPEERSKGAGKEAVRSISTGSSAHPRLAWQSRGACAWWRPLGSSTLQHGADCPIYGVKFDHSFDSFSKSSQFSHQARSFGIVPSSFYLCEALPQVFLEQELIGHTQRSSAAISTLGAICPKVHVNKPAQSSWESRPAFTISDGTS